MITSCRLPTISLIRPLQFMYLSTLRTSACFCASFRAWRAQCYVEVPLEHTFRVHRSIQTSAPYGHLDFYTPETFKNLLSTAELSLLSIAVFSNSLDYEVFLSRPFVGKVKHIVRSSALKLLPRLAPKLFVYLGGAVLRTQMTKRLSNQTNWFGPRCLPTAKARQYLLTFYDYDYKKRRQD